MFFYSENSNNINNNPTSLFWVQQQILSGSLTDGFDWFGNNVAFSEDGSTLVVSAINDTYLAGYKANGDEIWIPGRVYVFKSGSDGWTERAILSGSSLNIANDSFGFSVAVNSAGNKIIVGSRNDKSPNNYGASSGIAYIFSSGSGGWTQEKILSGSLARDPYDQFGYSVAINSSGNIAVVGARGDEPTTQFHTYAQGLAYIFVSGANGWIEQQILTGSLANNSADAFGNCVAINSTGNRILVGAEGDEVNTGNLSNGLVYVFDSGSGGWTQKHILSGSRADPADFFSTSIAVSADGNMVVVGAVNDEPSGTINCGAAYVFSSGSSGWIEQQILTGSLATSSLDYFGYSVAINTSGNHIVVGAYGDENISGPSAQGLAYIYVSGSSGWVQHQIISGSLATGSNDSFGFSVAVNPNGNTIAVSAKNDEISGLVYVFNK